MCIGLDSYLREGEDGRVQHNRRAEGKSFSSFCPEGVLPWPAVEYSGIACIRAALIKRSDSAGSNPTTAVFSSEIKV